jgi:hypothetical protein
MKMSIIFADVEILRIFHFATVHTEEFHLKELKLLKWKIFMNDNTLFQVERIWLCARTPAFV